MKKSEGGLDDRLACSYFSPLWFKPSLLLVSRDEPRAAQNAEQRLAIAVRRSERRAVRRRDTSNSDGLNQSGEK